MFAKRIYGNSENMYLQISLPTLPPLLNKPNQQRI